MRVEGGPATGPSYNPGVPPLPYPTGVQSLKVFLTLTAAALLLAGAGPSVAIAHQGDSRFRSELEGVSPSDLSEGLDFMVGNYDDFIALSNRSGRAVTVAGYRGEPYLRFRPDGTVEANTRSPAWFANLDRYGVGEIPASADPDAPPVWKLVSEEGRYAWHDHRSHWMGKGVPPQVTDRSVRTEVFGYSIPLRIDGRKAELTGALFWVGSGEGPPVWPFLLLGLVAVGGTGLLILRRRQSDAAAESGDDDA